MHLLTDPNAKADYARCVSIATTASLREMVWPSLLAVAAPIATGLLLNIAGVMGLLAGALTAGFAMAVFMANAGGAWDNAKKYIEAGHYGGKGSDAHKAAVVGDTVGDPCKDTSGPSLNILIKLMSMVAIVFALWHGEFAKALAESDLADIDVTKEVRRGVAHREIITAAEEHQADLIVMGATGRTGLARLLIGGTTRCVLGHLPCSLLTVKQQDMVEELLEEDIRTIHRLMAEARELMAAASFDKAGAKYRQVLARNPFHIVAVEKLAEVHEKLGDDDHAQTYRRRAHTLRGE